MTEIWKHLEVPSPLPEGDNPIDVFAIYPAPPQPTETDGWPSDVARTYRDAFQAIGSEMSDAAKLQLIGTCLEVATKGLGTEGNSSRKRIDDALTKGLITRPLSDWSHHIRGLRNDAIHDGLAENGVAEELFEFLDLFLHVTYRLPKQIEAKRGEAGE